MYPTQTIFCVLQTPHFYNPSGALAPAPFTGVSLLCLCEHCGCAPCFSVRGIPYAPASGINLIFVGEGLPLPFCRAIRLYKTILCPLHNLFPYPLFLCRCRRKEKAIKKKRQRKDAQEGTFYKKSPLDSLKNFSATDAGHSVCDGVLLLFSLFFA